VRFFDLPAERPTTEPARRVPLEVNDIHIFTDAFSGSNSAAKVTPAYDLGETILCF
jgi:hypothetical protein